MRLLAGDIGGTKTILALIEEGRVVHRHTFASRDFEDFDLVLARFLTQVNAEGLERGCLGIAGPVIDDRCNATNLPWIVDGPSLARRFGLKRLRLVNDFTALAHGVLTLAPEQFAVLHQGTADANGPWVLLGAGTGLGEAVIVRGERGVIVLPSEGGHGDFAARSALEDRLLAYARGLFGRVSTERLVSGPGLVVLYRFLRDAEGLAERANVRGELDALGADEAPAVISRHALNGTDALCAKSLDLFMSLYGAEAGNLALKVIPRGGVFVGGGIAPKILPALANGIFRESFLAKGRMRPVLEEISVKAVLEPDAGLFGAAALASAPDEP